MSSNTGSGPARRHATARMVVGAVVVVTCLVAGVAALIYRDIALGHPVSWDEGAHSLFGLAIAHDLRRGDLVAFAYDTYRQVYWPPLHSWLTGAAFLAFGERIAVARSVSLGAYIAAPLALFAAARLMVAREERFDGWVAALAAGTLAVAMPAMIPMASMAFLDLPALVAVILTLLAAFYAERAREQPKRRAWIAAGILAAFFLKTNYGVLLMLVFGIDALIDAGFSPRRLLTRRNGYVVVPVLIVLAAWFAYPPKLASTIRAMVNTPAGANPWTLDGLLFYPRTLLTFAGSWPMLGGMLAAYALAWTRRREPNVRLLLVVATLQFVLGQVHHTKEDRHILPAFPALVLLMAMAAAALSSRARRNPRYRSAVWLGAGAALVVVAANVSAIIVGPLRTWRTTPTHRLGEANRALVSLIRGATSKGERVLLIGAFELEPGPPVVDWDLVVNEGALDIAQSGAIGVFDRDRSVAATVRQLPLPGWLARPVLRVLDRGDSQAAVRTFYAGLPDRLDSAAFARSAVALVRASAPDLVLVATALRSDVRYDGRYFEPAVVAASLRRVSAREFPGATGMRIEEYRRQ